MGRISVQNAVRGTVSFILTWTFLSCWQSEVLLEKRVSRQLANLPILQPTPIKVDPNPMFSPYIFRTSKGFEMNYKAKRYMQLCDGQNPRYHAEFYTDEQSRDFVRYYYPEFADAYDQLPVPVMRADLWRYLVIHQFGGFYMDTDVQCRSPIDRWGRELLDHGSFSDTDTIGMMIGTEFCNCTANYGHQSGTIQFVQWIFGAKPKHPVLYRAAEIAIANARRHNATDPLTVTGPVVFTQAILEHFVANGALTSDQIIWALGEGETHQVVNAAFVNCRERNALVGDVAVLNKQAFGYHREHVNSPDWASEELYVEHHFFGAWRKKRARRMRIRSTE